MRILVDSSAFMDQFERDLAQATRSVAIQAMSFEGDQAGLRLARLLRDRHDLDRTLVINRYSLFYVSDCFLPAPWNAVSASLWRERALTLAAVRELRRHGVTVFWTNPVGLAFRKFIARNHKKSVVIDRRAVYFGGMNFCDHNFDWHDVMLRVEDEELGAFMCEEIQATLRGGNQSIRRDFGGIEILLLDGVGNEEGFEPVFRLICEARRSIVVESAYVTFPFYSHLAQAVRRGIAVTIIAPEHNNKPNMNRYTQWEAARAGIELHLYPGRMNHIKAMLVDDEALIMGSSNFDYLSVHAYQEVVAIVREPAVIEQYRREVLDADLARCVAPTRRFSAAWQSARRAAFGTLGRAAVGLSRL
ncbi:MAG TPA: phosphatidylserine/phosphatidylglycerophosphate/cardiolipin synthase family protein [Vicinamibacterales bacterium]|nr:phosphatidylserine/phosphatidylglycerophosphate/cardiolipin synthase family protein [Vicinamibacterales bacterium]HOQ59697.1 phosphatidylserine/phosphatidylglycerophosphate/cardiolipin synthase family protein [Vicinamibacterales bacterium]HPK70440.1 phosphatidylserine/phosphatidylglycerophosphate/cardiolipin synthase family protein [Vicinamibacterales bacterium]